MIFKIIYYETIKDRLEDARVHCVVLKVRAVPSALPALPTSQKVLSFVWPNPKVERIRSLRTQQRACAISDDLHGSGCKQRTK